MVKIGRLHTKTCACILFLYYNNKIYILIARRQNVYLVSKSGHIKWKHFSFFFNIVTNSKTFRKQIVKIISHNYLCSVYKKFNVHIYCISLISNLQPSLYRVWRLPSLPESKAVEHWELCFLRPARGQTAAPHTWHAWWASFLIILADLENHSLPRAESYVNRNMFNLNW